MTNLHKQLATTSTKKLSFQPLSTRHTREKITKIEQFFHSYEFRITTLLNIEAHGCLIGAAPAKRYRSTNLGKMIISLVIFSLFFFILLMLATVTAATIVYTHTNTHITLDLSQSYKGRV
jgi:hypothetical protein